jgi:hypothetical protein
MKPKVLAPEIHSKKHSGKRRKLLVVRLFDTRPVENNTRFQ